MTLLRSREPSRAVLIAVVVCVLASIASIAMRVAIPILPYFAAIHDDGLMVSTADSLMNGQWLGPWSNLTLAKGPGYPLFLAAIHPFGLPSVVGVQLVYLVGSALVAFGTWRWLHKCALSAGLFVLLAFNPVMFGADASRLYREGWTAALAVTVLGLTIIISQLCTSRSWSVRWVLGFGVSVIAMGVAVTWLTLTRVDSILWVGAAMAFLAVAAIFLRSSTGRERLVRAGWLLGTGVFLVVVVSGGQRSIAAINEQHYGAAIVDDFSEGSFAAASNSWASVVAGPPRQWVSITAQQREAVYQVSATARSLRPFLEVPDGTSWKQHSCRFMQMCDEAGTWFPWMLRDAALAAAPIHDEADFRRFFTNLNNEITAACASAELACAGPGLGPALPRADLLDKGLVLADMGGLMQIQLNFANVIVTGDPGSTTPDVLDRWGSVDHGFDYPAALDIWTSDPQRLSVVGPLREIYSKLAWILVVPALLGLGWGLFAGGRNRVASLIGLAAAAGVLAHAAVLGVYYAATYPLGTGSPYTVSSESFLIVTLCIGTWLCGRFARLWFLRRAGDADHQQVLATVSAGNQSKSSPLVSCTLNRAWGIAPALNR